MCESTVYLVESSRKSVVMENVAIVRSDETGITCIDGLGERKVVADARIAETNLARHEVLLRKRGG